MHSTTRCEYPPFRYPLLNMPRLQAENLERVPEESLGQDRGFGCNFFACSGKLPADTAELCCLRLCLGAFLLSVRASAHN